ncbi:flagellar type III secretion system protein FlhB [Salipiger marinus]|uniref:EscU/YscU/HrcU family type III secretion system export apparatus switch protein n=1 Tax=Salipiger marinus TaxID=555512 RepID=UPI002BE60A30|nr:flagellar type III secretion system protein FlhB [Salipiger manganoxidans]MEB3417350.1 flagellar type III secretion system protein FlhB [Salipiger manganoxidans]
MAADDDGEKSHDASQRKLEDARKKGEIPRSADLLTAAAYSGLVVAALAMGGQSLESFGESLLPMLDQPEELSKALFGGMATAATAGLLQSTTTPLLSWLGLPPLLVGCVLFASRGVTVTASRLAPKLSRISPLENARNKFGRRGLFEFMKSFVKLVIYASVLGIFLSNRLDQMMGSLGGTPGQVTMLMAALLTQLLVLAALVAMTLGVLDFLWQYGEHLRRNRMSHKELRDEFKESEGDPMFRQHRRARAQEIAMNRMMLDVPNADVVIVNPVHYAVALKWSRKPGEAPICVAKGADEIARRIREIAEEHGVPIHSNPPAARALFASTKIGQQISRDHYRAVAAAIRFAEEMRQKSKAVPGGAR